MTILVNRLLSLLALFPFSHSTKTDFKTHPPYSLHAIATTALDYQMQFAVMRVCSTGGAFRAVVSFTAMAVKPGHGSLSIGLVAGINLQMTLVGPIFVLRRFLSSHNSFTMFSD